MSGWIKPTSIGTQGYKFINKNMGRLKILKRRKFVLS